MLKLWRSMGQTVVIGKHGEIKVTLMCVNRDSALLLFDAPKTIPIDRLEILDLRRNSEKLTLPRQLSDFTHHYPIDLNEKE